MLSYRGLLGVPGFARLAVGMLLARAAAQIWQLALVLLVLQKFGSPQLAGLAVFFATGPAIAASPFAGALLDRHGRVRLVLLDYLVAGVALSLIVVLSFTGQLRPTALLRSPPPAP